MQKYLRRAALRRASSRRGAVSLENPAFATVTPSFFYCILRHTRPARVIEVGSGYSSCALLDTNELFFGNSIACTFIEPYPQLLTSLLKDGDDSRITVVAKNLQDVELSVFSELSAGDVLFVDSSHVSKTNSDVNYVFFEILPRLSSGVYIHFHDIFYPFEYPKEWVYQGRAWNEAYLPCGRSCNTTKRSRSRSSIPFSSNSTETNCPRDAALRQVLAASMMQTSAQSLWLTKR